MVRFRSCSQPHGGLSLLCQRFRPVAVVHSSTLTADQPSMRFTWLGIPMEEDTVFDTGLLIMAASAEEGRDRPVSGLALDGFIIESERDRWGAVLLQHGHVVQIITTLIHKMTIAADEFEEVDFVVCRGNTQIANGEWKNPQRSASS